MYRKSYKPIVDDKIGSLEEEKRNRSHTNHSSTNKKGKCISKLVNRHDARIDRIESIECRGETVPPFRAARTESMRASASSIVTGSCCMCCSKKVYKEGESEREE